MEKKVTVTLTIGFLMGLGFASCASVDSDRSLASDGRTHYAKAADHAEDKIECLVGEERNENGDCERPHDFDRPFRRGGR